jgi:hypothetical protein
MPPSNEAPATVEPLRREASEATLLQPRGAGRLAWSRVGLVSLWVIALGLLAARVASSWEEIVGSLASAPRQETLR